MELVEGVGAVEVKPSSSALCCVSFHDVSYEVSQWKYCARQPNKRILKAVSGLMLSGVNAIMGPTGSGKTTLLDILADRKDKSGLSGSILINGNRRPHNFKCLVGYVVQEDVVMGTLTVRENLQFSAALRLSSHMTRRQRKERVEAVINELGLQLCANTKVGTEFVRGVSGGERKRTNIGMELIIEPQVLFLDEPTTGLDAHTAVSVVQLLRNLSQVNDRIVIMSIHQPRYSIFKLFDTLTMLSLGSIVYHGMPGKSLGYFEKLGFPCEEHENPADFFLDIILLNEPHGKNNSGQGNEASDDGPGAVNFSGSYLKSNEYRELRSVVDPMLDSLQENETSAGMAYWLRGRKRSSVAYSRSFFWQLLIVSLRSTVNLLRTPTTTIIQLILMIIFGLIVGGIYFGLDTGPLGFTDRIGVFFFVAVNQSFGRLSAIDLFIQQRALFIHENASGYYRVSAFFIAKVMVDLVPLGFIPTFAFAIITYFMIGLQLEAEKFFIYFLILNLTNIAAASIAFCVSAAVRVGAVASLLIALAFVVAMLFGGLLIALESLPGWIEWMKYLSFIRYSIEAMAINEMDGLVFSGPCSECLGDDFNTTLFNATTCSFDGLARLEQLGYEKEWLWYDVLALIVIAAVFQIVAYIILRLIKKEK